VRIPAENGSTPGGGSGGSGGGGGADTTPPAISSVNSSNVTTSSATITWNTNEGSDTQVEYGKTTSYGSSTSLNSSMVTSHSASLGNLTAGTLYHYRVKSKDSVGNLAVSANFTFTTPSSGGGGGGGGTGSLQNVVWTNAVNCTVNGNNLKKVSGYGDTSDAGARSQQVLASGNGYVEFTSSENNTTKFVGFARNANGTQFEGIDFSIKLTDYGVAEVRESNVYKSEVTYRGGDVFRVAVEGGAVKYYKNGQVFYTSSKAPSYPLIVDASLIVLNATVGNAVIAATSGGALAMNSMPESQFFATRDSREPSLLAGGHIADMNNSAFARPAVVVGLPDFDRSRVESISQLPRVVAASAWRQRAGRVSRS
jgi:hypothetical protein